MDSNIVFIQHRGAKKEQREWDSKLEAFVQSSEGVLEPNK